MKALRICGENFVNSQDVFTLTSGGAQSAYLYGQDRSKQVGSSGSSEGASWQVLVEFYDRLGNTKNIVIDRIIMQNHNLAKFKWEYWDGAAYQLISESDFTSVANTAVDNYIEIAVPITTQKLRLTATNTIGAVAEKLLGPIKACLFVVTANNLVAFSRRDWDNGGAYRLQGGPLVTFMDVSKVEADVQIDNLDLTTYELVAPLVIARSWMTWVLYQDFRLKDIYEVAATGPLQESLDRKMYLYTVNFPTKQR